MRRKKSGTILCAFCLLLTGQAVLAQAPPDIWDPDMDTLGVTLEPAAVSVGQRYWRLVEGWADDPVEGGEKINIFFKTKDLGGSFIGGVWVRTEWNGGYSDIQTKADPDWGDYPMSGGNWCPATPPGPYSTKVLGRNQSSPDPSDRVVGMGLPCNNHWSFRLIFEETIATVPDDTPTPTNTPLGGTVPTVNNPGFESCVTGWSMWTGSGSNSDALECDIPPGGTVDGSRCLAVKGIGTGGKGAYQYLSSDWIPGYNYRLSVYCKNLANLNMNYSIGYVLGSGSSANGPTANYGTTVPNPSSWTQATVEFTYSGSSGVTIYLRAVNAGDSERAGFDLVEIANLGPTETPTPTPTSTYATPPPTVTPSDILEDYEDGFTGGVENDWTGWEDSTWGSVDLREADLGRSGVGFSQGIRVVYGSGGTFRQDVPVTPGEEYYLRTWIRTLKGDKSSAVDPPSSSVFWAEFGYDLANRDFAAVGDDPAISYWESTPKDTGSLGSTEWQEFTTPAFTATGSFISLWVKVGAQSPNGIYLSIDDWELVSTSAPPDPTSTPTVTRTPTPPAATPTSTPGLSMIENWEEFSPDR